MMTRTPLLNPAGYFEADTGGRLRVVLVFLLYLFGTLFSFHIIMEVLFRRLGEIGGITRTQIQAGVSILSFQWTFAMLLTLFVTSLVVHYLGSGGLSPQVTYKETLTLTLWSFLPGVLLLPVRAAYAYLAVDGSSISTEEAEPVVDAVEALAASGSDPVVLGIVLVGTAWTVYILGSGIQRTYGTARMQAFAVAALVGALLAFAWFGGIQVTLAGL